MFWKKKPEAKSEDQQKPPFLVAWRNDSSGMVVNIDSNQIENPGVAGLMLADLYRHFARALQQGNLATTEEHARAEMMAMFLAEIQSPTDEGIGSSNPN
jgi:Domain of unknown function (DUF5076)